QTDRFRNLLVGAYSRFPVIYSFGACFGYFTGIEEVGSAEIEVDIADRLTNAAAHRDLGGRLSGQFDAGYSDPGVELSERRFDSGADRRLVIGQCCPAIYVVCYKTGADIEFDLVCRAIRRWVLGFARGPAAPTQVDCTGPLIHRRLWRDLRVGRTAAAKSKPQPADRGHRASANATQFVRSHVLLRLYP